MSSWKGMSGEPTSLGMLLGDETRDRLRGASPMATESS